MKLSLLNFSTLVEQSAAAVQASASQLLDFTVGSVLRALLEANASLALWLQWLVLLTLQTTRLATSSGPDADSFGADFGFTRLSAIAAAGNATFSRYSAGMTALIPVGTQVSTADGSTDFVVVADNTHASWSTGQDGYLLGAGVASVTVPIVAAAAGSSGNVLAGTITLMTSAIPGVDSVTNTNALAGGLNAESDAAFRLRFQGFLDSRTRATLQAISYAAMSVQQNVTCTVQENFDAAGNELPGHFIVTVDDGSGVPPPALLAAVQTAVDAVRPIGSTFAIQPPTVIAANISLNLVLVPGTQTTMAIAAVNAAIASYIASLPVGASLAYTRLAQLAYDADAGIANVNDLLLQGGTADLTASSGSVIRLGTLAIS